MSEIPQPALHSTDPKFQDLTGQKFGRLTVQYYVGKIGKGIRQYSSWYCICECGGWSVPIIQSLKKGQAISCEQCSRTKLKDENGNRLLSKPDYLICPKCEITLPFTSEFWYERKEKTAFGLVTENCRECYKKYKRIIDKIERITIRIRLLYHYSNGVIKCANCEEKYYEMLTLDHINNDGKQDREKRGMFNFQWQLYKNNYPEGIQVLCFNCNIKKEIQRRKYK